MVRVEKELERLACGVSPDEEHRRWTPWEDKRLQELFDEGLTWAQISSQIRGRTARAVESRFSKVGLHRSKVK